MGKQQSVLWAITGPAKKGYDIEFAKLPQTEGKVLGADMRTYLFKTGLPGRTLKEIWDLADVDQDGKLDSDEFAVAKYLVEALKSETIKALPKGLPDRLIPPSKRYLFDMGTE